MQFCSCRPKAQLPPTPLVQLTNKSPHYYKYACVTHSLEKYSLQASEIFSRILRSEREFVFWGAVKRSSCLVSSPLNASLYRRKMCAEGARALVCVCECACMCLLAQACPLRVNHSPLRWKEAHSILLKSPSGQKCVCFFLHVHPV